MGLFSKIFGSKKNKIDLNETELIEVGACPNCWGYQEYDDQFVAYNKDITKSNINNDKQNQKAFVQQFVETHITGIRLKTEGEQLACPTCKTKYKQVSSKLN